MMDDKDRKLLTFKIKVEERFYPRLEELLQKSKISVKQMIFDRSKSSSKYYPEIPCILAKSLIRKYQRNKKLKNVKNMVLPLCGSECGVKLNGNKLRISSFFQKDTLDLIFPKPRISPIRHLEFFKRDKIWYLSYSYFVPVQNIQVENYIGVDRNSVGNVVAVSSKEKVFTIGPSTSGIAKNFRDRRSKLQKKGVFNALKRIKRKQSRRIKDINHKVSRAIVDYAKSTLSAIVLEDLSGINKKKSKIKRYVQKSQWSFYQLEEFIKYKAALFGIPIYYVDPKNTSKRCSSCGSLNIPNGKVYKCKVCGHVAHRDHNAAINIRHLAEQGNILILSGLIGNPQTGKGEFCYAK